MLDRARMEKSVKIYVGNLSHETTEAQLREAFVKYGDVASLAIVIDKENGKSRGFGFIEMHSDQHANAAITGLNGKELGGKPLKVNEATKK